MRDPIACARDNLSLWQEAACENRELRLLQSESLGREIAKSFSADGAPLPLLWHTGEKQDVFARVMHTEEQIAFLRGFLQSCDYRPETLLQGEAHAPAPAAPRVVFLDSFFGREALRRFEAVLPLPRAATAPSFTAVCEELVGGRADFAILPLEDSTEGKFLRLYQEIDRFELYITHTCEVPYGNEGQTMLMALLSRHYTPVLTAPGEQMLACTLLEEDSHTLSELLLAAGCCQLSLRRVDTLPSSYGENIVFYQPLFAAPHPEDELLFLTYLELFQPRARAMGRYLHLKEKNT